MSDSRLTPIAEISALRLHREMEELAPFLAARLSAWIEEMFGMTPLADRFLHLSAFPILSLPWWVEESFSSPDQERQEALALSSMAGYLFIRLIDNVMDGDGPGDRRLLPVLAPLSTIFVRPYQEWFPPTHPFWPYFHRVWAGTADFTARDAHLAEIDLETFHRISAQKTGAAKIPAAAVCHLHDRLDRLHVWEAFIETFGRFHQLYNDLNSWCRDVRTGTATFLLSEAGRRRRSDEQVADWLLRDGLDWAMTTLRGSITELLRLAPLLESPGLTVYVDARREAFERDVAIMRRGAAEVEKLGKLIGVVESRRRGTRG